MKKLSSLLAASLVTALAVPAGAATLEGTLPRIHRTVASSGRTRAATLQAVAAIGVGINLDVCGRVQTTGGLARTSVDIANNTNVDTQVDAYFSGVTGGVHIDIVVGITAAGFVDQGTAQMARQSVFHSDDFIDDLRVQNLISQAEENAGVLGSLFVIYNSPSVGLFDQIGQGSVQARFFSDQFGGTVGVSANGHELTSSEPSSLVGIARDTVGESNTPQVQTNFFVNNEGYADNSGNLVVNPVTVRLTGFSNATGAQLPNHPTFAIGPFETIAMGNLFAVMGANKAQDDTIIIFVDIINQGNSAISGLSSTNDITTKDPSAAQLRPADWTNGR